MTHQEGGVSGPDPNEITRTTPIRPEPAASLVPQPVDPVPVTPDPARAAAPEPAPAKPLTPPVYEATLAWAPAEPVVKAAGAPRRRGRLRWAVALAMVAIIITMSAAIAALIVGRSPDAVVLGYVPENAIAYAEVRLDLPGDQRLAVGEFLSKFPGFHDQAALDGKLDEVLDQLVKDATNDEQTYTADIKPWFGGEVGVSVGPLPDPKTLVGGDSASLNGFQALALLSVKDPEGAQAWFEGAFKKTGATSSTETYGGATVTLYSNGDGPKAALAIIGGEVAAVGDETSVKAAIDTKGNSGFADEAGPKAALDAADQDHIGFVYVALKPLVEWANGVNGQVSALGRPVASPLSAAMLEYLPEWGSYWLRIENDAVVAEAVMPTPEEGVAPAANRSSTIVDHVPATSVAAIVGNDYGATLTNALDLYRSEPSLKPVVDQIDQALGLLGGTDAALGWIGDVAIVVNVADGAPEGGVIALPTDPAAAKSFFTSIKSLVALGGAQAGATVREETYNGTTITIIDVGDLAALTGKAGVPTVPGIPGGKVEIAFAATDDLVVVGSGPGFVKRVLDTTKATSLGGDDRYRSLASRAGTGSSVIFVDIAAIRGHVEQALPTLDPKAAADYDKNVKPYLTPFDALIGTGSVGNDLTHSTFIITVK
jgi:hypothetical protein